MALNDVYELVHKQVYQNQEVLNVYYYRQFVPFVIQDEVAYPNVAAVLAKKWAEEIVPDIINLQSSTILSTGIAVRNLFVPADEYEHGISVAGLNSDQGLPTFVAYKIALATENSQFRVGAKRLAGVDEGLQSNGVVKPETFTGANAPGGVAESIATKQISYGGLLGAKAFEHVAVKRVKTVVNNRTKYRLPNALAELVFSRIVDGALDILLTSQGSRKVGIGR